MFHRDINIDWLILWMCTTRKPGVEPRDIFVVAVEQRVNESANQKHLNDYLAFAAKSQCYPGSWTKFGKYPSLPTMGPLMASLLPPAWWLDWAPTTKKPNYPPGGSHSYPKPQVRAHTPHASAPTKRN